MLFDPSRQSATPMARFINLTPEGRALPSWVVAHTRGVALSAPTPAVLRPARVPRELLAGSPPNQATSSASAAQPAGAASKQPPAPPAEPAANEPAEGVFREAIVQLASARSQLLQDSQQQLVRLATLIAERVIAREASLDPSIILALARQGLEALEQHDSVTVRIGTGFESLRAAVEADLDHQGVTCKVIVDPQLSEHGCVVGTRLGQVDESLDRRLETLVQALTGESASGAPK